MSMPTFVEIATVLKHLTPKAKSAFIAEKAKDQDMAWLRGMAEQGAFLVPLAELEKPPFPSNARFIDADDSGFPNVVALAGVIDAADFERLNQPGFVTRAKPVTLRVGDDFKSFLYDTSLALMQSVIEFRDNAKRLSASEIPNQASATSIADTQWQTQRMLRFSVAVEETFLALLQTACACDDGKTANLLLQGTNRLGTMYSSSRLLGIAAALLPGDHGQRSQARVNPMCTAMLFSAESALDAMEEHGFPLQKTIALYPRAAGETKSTDPLKAQYPDKYSARMPIDFIASNDFPCTGRTLERVLKAGNEGGFRVIDAEPFLTEAHRLLLKDRTPYENERKDAFMHAGVYDIKGKKSVGLAIKSFDFELVDRLGKFINWLEDAPFGGTQYHWEVTSLFSNAIARNRAKDPKVEGRSSSEDMVLTLMDLGAAAGHGHRFYEQQSPHQSALVKWSIEKDHPRVLVKMMENGLEPDRRLLLNDTAFGLAEKANKKEAEHLMRTFVSGQLARKTLAEMDFSEDPISKFGSNR